MKVARVPAANIVVKGDFGGGEYSVELFDAFEGFEWGGFPRYSQGNWRSREKVCF